MPIAFREQGIPIESFLPLALALAGVLLALWLTRAVVERLRKRSAVHGLTGQVFLLGVLLAGMVVIILALPVEASLRNQLLAIFGLVLSAAIALASTNFLGNLMAGLMLASFRNFRVGDFLRCEGHFGRVTERGLLHTELQTEDRDLLTLPNLYLATRPVKVVRASGTILHATVSLGYDVPHRTARGRLREAAHATGLEDSFCRILELGDFSIVYQVGGLLRDLSELYASRTRLRGEMLDRLHEHGIEIVSPVYFNTRRLSTADVVAPRGDAVPLGGEEPSSSIDRLAFDKANLAELVERLRRERAGLVEEQEELQERRTKVESDEVRAALDDELARLAARIERLNRVIAQREERLKDEG